MHRRHFLTLLGATLTAPAHEWLIAHAIPDASSNRGALVPASVVDELDTATAALRRMDDEMGSGQLTELVQAHLSVVTTLLEQRRYTDRVGRSLHATAGELLRLKGWLAFDSGHHAQAQRAWIAALYQAHASGERSLGANILGFMSCQAKDLGQTREAVRLAETALAASPNAAPQVRAILALRAAEAYATDHETRPARAAIDAAFEHLNAATPQHGQPDWAYWMSEQHAHGQAGYAYLRLGDFARARSHFASAAKGSPNGTSREDALRQTLMATTLLRQKTPDVDQALSLGRTAVGTLQGQVQSTRVVGHVENLLDQMRPYRRTAAVRDFLDEGRQLLAQKK